VESSTAQGSIAMKSRPRGTSSYLHRIQGKAHFWTAPNGQLIEFPLMLDLMHINEQTGGQDWLIEAELHVIDNQPELVSLQVKAKRGLDVSNLQKFFRWATPLDVVTITVPELLSRGINPFEHEYAVNGYPDAAHLGRKQNARLSESFLEDIAQQYLKIGRGYAKEIARVHGVSERTVVSWIEKARKRRILSEVHPGQYGGHIIPTDER
jgi:hypothetical protein